MTNGDKLRKNLSKQLSKGTEEHSSGSSTSSRHAGVPLFMRGRKRDPQVGFADNPLLLASTVAVPEGFTTGNALAAQGSGVLDLHIEIDSPVDPFASSFSRERSHGSYSAISDQTCYALATNSPRAGGSQDSLNKIVDVASMSHRDSDNNLIEEPNLNVPIDVKNLNVIGASPPGYYAREEPPLKQALKEAHRIWIAPMVAGLLTFIDNWWKKTIASRRQQGKDSLNGMGAAVQGIRDNTLALDPQELFTARVAGATLLLLLAVFLVYAWFEQRKRNEEVMFETGKFNIDRTNITSLVPNRKYLIDKVNLARKIEPPQGPPKSTNPARFYVSYQYPPSRNNYRLRR